MKIKFEKSYISITSPMVVFLVGYICGGKYGAKHARAIGLFPFIIFRNEETREPWLINHERLHLRQQVELLWIGCLLLDVSETLFALLILRKSYAQAYLWRSSEQEAYRNQQDFEYLKKRKPFAQFWYFTHKREFTFGKPGEIIFKD